jgi:serine/threonine protein kinase
MATPEDRLAAYFDTSQSGEPFTDEQIETIALLLARCSHATERRAGRSPRTYIICRMIGQCDLLPRLLSEGFGDDWFPVSKAGLPGYLDPRTKTKIFETQHIILTKSLNLENGRHCHFGTAEQHPFDIQSRIGSGSFGQVHVVESRVTHKQYALKTVRRSKAFGTKSKEIMSIFKSEMKIMKGLRHKHIVCYIGSYTDRNDLGLLISPVADCDLEEYLEKACKTPNHHPTLRTFFGCLATALSYLHDEEIKHRDIKPKNILVHKANVLLADFGISHDFLDTTTGPTIATQKYCSPEVANQEGRNASADVWSLGCVFLEIQSALQGKDSDWMNSWYETHGNGSTRYHSNTDGTLDLLRELRSATRDDMHARPLNWIEHMLTVNRRARPTAAEITNQITSADSLVSFLYSCNQCSYPSSEPGSVEYTEIGTLDAHQPAQDSDAQQVTTKAMPTTTSSQVSLDPSRCTTSERPSPVRNLPSSAQSLSSIPSAPTAVLYGPSLEHADAQMITRATREVGREVNSEGKSERKVKSRVVKHSKHRGRASRDLREDAGSVSPPQGILTTTLTSGLGGLSIESSRSAAPPTVLESIAVSRTAQIPKCIDYLPESDEWPRTNSLYKDQDGFSKGPHKFTFKDQVTSWEGWVPNVVIYCTQEMSRISRMSWPR